ncbi:DASH family cryptochrome [Halomonas sp. C05BenzN]|uniref:DASH family cryptochrome n=1 Tax=Halomonas sp. C05BenzN TaxID=3411041 RepID=UPI003B94C6C7
MSLEIALLRHDLRVGDNPLLCGPLSDHLLCVHVLDRAWLEPLAGPGVPRIGPARLKFLWESLIELRGELLRRGSDLLVRIGDPVEVVADLALHHGATRLRVRREAGSDETETVCTLGRRLRGRCAVVQVDGGMLFEEASLPIPVAALPATFSAFRRRVERTGQVPRARPSPLTLPPWPRGAARGLPALHALCARAAGWQADPRGAFRFVGGEKAGLARLDHYLWQSDGVARYKQTRNGLLGADFSTRLSPWLALGCLSARQVHDAVRTWEAEHGASASSGWVIFELLWRDYFHWAGRQEGRALFGARSLPVPGTAFRAWAAGETGTPFIDAAMRELAATGWLSNRARQNVASYLVRELGVDWRLGAAWFEHCLIDFDAASNWGNWRYVAGVGRDPRDRGFHVLRQAERYDARGDYVAHWLPELASLPPGAGRHRPWRVAPRRFPRPLAVPAPREDGEWPPAGPEA